MLINVCFIQALNTQEFSMIVVSIIIMTMVVPPLTMVYHPVDNVEPYKRRTIEKSKAEEELRILACIYDMRNVPSIINLLEASYASQRSPISVFALHLVELIGRATAMVIVHTTRKAGTKHLTQAEAQTEQIISAFDNYELRCDGVMVQALTARSAFSSMDEDICGVAKSKRAAFIILPFHRQQAHDGEMEDINPSIRNVNENVLVSTPCSVGILIDRRMPDSFEFPRRVAVLFFGGPDDREALAYAWRMSEHENVTLTVVKLVPAKPVAPSDPMDFMGAGNTTVAVPIDAEKERVLDDECINKFNIDTVNDNSVTFQELVLNDEEETIRTIKGMDGSHDLFIVGRGRGAVSPLTAGLADWCDCPELGPIGDLFATSEFSSSFSVLVMQQYVKSAESTEESELSAESFARQESEQLQWRASNATSEDVFGSFDSKERKFSHES